METLVILVNNIGVIPAICFIAGLLLVVIEMFAPGFGIPGIAGGLLLILGVIFTAKTLLQALILIIIILLILGACLTIIINLAKRGKISRGIILLTSMDKDKETIKNEDMKYFIGKEGIVLTTLRPVGSADFDGVKLEVTAENEFIKNGCKVKITKINGNKIIVKRF